MLAHIKAIQLSRTIGKGKRLPFPKTTNVWPIDYEAVYAWRAHQLRRIEADPSVAEKLKAYYSTRPEEFINHWCDTYDPRNVGVPGKLVHMPFILFDRQALFLKFLIKLLKGDAPGLVEKCRDMGATYVAIGLAVWMWVFWPAVAIGFGSATGDKVDKKGDMSTLFEKVRMMIQRLPAFLQPQGFNVRVNLLHQRILNPQTGSAIIGEIGPQIGRGGRTRFYVVDEAAHLEHPEEVDAALSENTRCRVDISSVSGPGTPFHLAREAGVEWEDPEQPVEKYTTNVFIMDWRHHPGKGQEWYNGRKKFYRDRGASHIFAQEVDRDYRASVGGAVIPSEWLDACQDAHIKLGFDDTGKNRAGLDLADGGIDKNALCRAKGSIVKKLYEWSAEDTGLTTRHAVRECTGDVPLELQYDSLGVGSGCKSEANRLMADGLMPRGLILVAWAASGAVLDPHGHTLKLANGQPDKQSPKNKDHYGNLKAQAWWAMRMRVWNTYRAITEGIEFDPGDLISFDTESIGTKMLIKLMQELAQAKMDTDSRLRNIVEKQPENTKSPNLADATIMAYWPVPRPKDLGSGDFVAPRMIGER